MQPTVLTRCILDLLSKAGLYSKKCPVAKACLTIPDSLPIPKQNAERFHFKKYKCGGQRFSPSLIVEK